MTLVAQPAFFALWVNNYLVSAESAGSATGHIFIENESV
jgi:hypothetical protein